MKKKTCELHNKVFTLLIVVSFISVVLNILNTSGHINKITMSYSFLIILDYMFYLSLCAILLIYAVYAISLTKNGFLNTRFRLKLVVLAPITMILILLASNPFSYIFFTYNNVYEHGPYLILFYAVALYYALFSVVYVIRERISTTRELKNALLLFLVINCISLTIQYFMPEVLILQLGLAFSELILLLNL